MAFKLHNWRWQVRIPHEDIEVETATEEHLVLFTVGHLSHGPLVTVQRLDR